MKTEYEVTISYKAIITVDIKAESEKEAQENALKLFKEKERHKWFSRQDITLQDDNYKVSGCLNMDETWNNI